MPVATSTALLITAGVAAAGVGVSVQQASQQRKAQKSALAAQDLAISRAEEKALKAREQAAQTAQDRLRKIRQAQTKTILTSPLGVTSEATLGQTSIF